MSPENIDYNEEAMRLGAVHAKHQEKSATPEEKEKQLQEMLDELFTLDVIRAGKDVWQNKFHEFDIYTHTQEFVRHMRETLGEDIDKDMLAAAVLHDVAKPVVAAPKEKDGSRLFSKEGQPYNTFPEHEHVGEDMVREMDDELFNKHGLDKELVAKLVGAHYIPMKGIRAIRRTTNREEFDSYYEDLLAQLEETGLSREDVMTMFMADSLAKGKGCTDCDELFAIREAVLSRKKGSELDAVYEMQKQEYQNRPDDYGEKE
ncbi:HD domain-containing protein [Patescibacteria group bacterium]